MRRFASVFAGIGGFDVGFEEAGWTSASLVENDKHARQVLAHNWPNVPLLGDITEVHGRDLGEIDTLIGGFPCQDVSIGAPYRAGLRGERSGLFHQFTRLVQEYQRVIDETRPTWCVLENVPGLLTSNGGEDMGTVLRSLAECGYSVSWRVVDAAGVGVPQRRRRVLVVGHRGSSACGREVLRDAGAGGVDPRLDHEGRGSKPRRPPTGASAEEHLGRVMFRKSRRPRSKTDFATWVESGLSNTLNGFDAGLKRTTNLIVDGDRARMLTPLEWERLQGFPDGHTDVGLSDNQRFRLLGNAMAVPMARWLADQMDAVPHLAAA